MSRVDFSSKSINKHNLLLDTSDYVVSKLSITRKYPLCGYILGVLTHTTAWDQHWGGDETLK